MCILYPLGDLIRKIFCYTFVAAIQDKKFLALMARDSNARNCKLTPFAKFINFKLRKQCLHNINRNLAEKDCAAQRVFRQSLERNYFD